MNLHSIIQDVEDLLEKKIWPDRDSIDYWRTMRDGLHVGFHGTEGSGSGIPVAGPTSMTGISSPLSAPFISSLKKGTFQAEAAKQPGMTMGALRFINSAFGKKSVNSSIAKVNKHFKGRKVRLSGKFNHRLKANNPGNAYGSRPVGLAYLHELATPTNGYAHMRSAQQQHYGSPTEKGVRALQLILKGMGVGGDLDHQAEYNKQDKFIDSDGKIDRVRVLRAFHGPLIGEDGTKIGAAHWTEENIAQVEENVKSFLRDQYAVNQWALREAAKRSKKSKSKKKGLPAFIKGGRVLCTRGTNKFSSLSREDTAAVATVVTQYDLGVLCNQRPQSGWSLGPGHGGYSYGPGKAHQLGLPSTGFVEKNKFVLRCAPAVETVLATSLAMQTGFDEEAELLVMGASEVPMKLTWTPTGVSTKAGPKGKAAIAAYQSDDPANPGKGGYGLPQPHDDSGKSTPEDEAALINGFLTGTPSFRPKYKGTGRREEAVSSLDNLLSQLG